MKGMISLPEGGPFASFDVINLIKNYEQNNIKHMIIGATHVTLANHPKPGSLDVWLRKQSCVTDGYKNTCQATKAVVDQLINSTYFSIGKHKCPVSNRLCKSLILNQA